VISSVASPAESASAAVRPLSEYFATETHYLSLAGRASAALRDGCLVLVTGDPPVSSQLISDALRRVTQGRDVVIVPCAGGLNVEQLYHTGCEVANLAATGGAAPILVRQAAESDPPLFVFDEIDQLSDQQLDQIREAVALSAEKKRAGVLLAGPDLLGRLEGPSLHFLKEALAACFRLDEIGEDEGIDFLRYQLQARHREIEARGIRPIAFRGLAALAAVAGIGIVTVFALRHMEMSAESPAGPAIGAYSVGAPPVTAPLPHASPPPVSSVPIAPEPTPDRKPPQPAEPAASPPSSSPQSPDQKSLSAADIAALMARGDRFLGAGDIASARLFYERAADAGDGSAALRLGATFDPGFLSRAGIRGTPGDPAQAALWYRRARDLGEAAAAERLKKPDEHPP
jgi:hypothetical protein